TWSSDSCPSDLGAAEYHHIIGTEFALRRQHQIDAREVGSGRPSDNARPAARLEYHGFVDKACPGERAPHRRTPFNEEPRDASSGQTLGDRRKPEHALDHANGYHLTAMLLQCRP